MKVNCNYSDLELRAGMLAQMKSEVVSFDENFDDQVFKNSAWGHHYFCPEDGNVLTFDLDSPQKHKCSLCGKTYISALLDRAWLTSYRNVAATTILKAALIYQKTEEIQYLNIVLHLSKFYLGNFEKFKLHNKEDQYFSSIEEMSWGCGRIMPQSLNESIFVSRIFTALEIVKEDLPTDFIEVTLNQFADGFFSLLKPQVDKVHNIPLWLNDGLGIVGLFTKRKDLQDFAFSGEYNVSRQLEEGLTGDKFWYEGSIHYNCFTIEGLLYLALFCKDYGVERPELAVIPDMLKQVYQFSFSNQQLPNPNDGWPNLNLKTYSYLFAMGSYIFSEDKELEEIFHAILAAKYERTDIPLSKPYYYDNKLSLEQFMLFDKVEFNHFSAVEKKSHNFESSNYVLLKNQESNLFLKYGHNGPSHAHPDKMNIEVVLQGELLLKDLSNSGYGSKMCNEWHRTTASHNTVVVDGKNQVSTERGILDYFNEHSARAEAINVYPDVNYKREVTLSDSGFKDIFTVTSPDRHTYDQIFHLLAQPIWLDEIPKEFAELGYKNEGYQYFSKVSRLVLPNENKLRLAWKFNGETLLTDFNIENKEIFYCQSPSNPVNEYLPTIIIRQVGKEAEFTSEWQISKE